MGKYFDEKTIVAAVCYLQDYINIFLEELAKNTVL